MPAYQLNKDGERVNDIICEPEFVEWYAAQHGYTYHEIPSPTPTTPEEVEPPELDEPTQLDRVEAQATYTAMMTDTLLEV